MDVQSYGFRIAERRKQLKLSQADLAKRIGRDRTAISRLESGKRRVSAFELAEIAEALTTSVPSLIGRPQPAPAMAVAYRVAAATVPGELGAVRSRARRLFELEALLDGIGQSGPLRPELPAIALTAGSGARQGRALAEEVRGVLRLGSAPIPELADLLESRLGIDVALEPMPEAVAGLCVGVDSAWLAMANSDVPLGRQRFTLAHELCHALCGDAVEIRVEREPQNSDPVDEVRANTFARHFLLPRSACESEPRGLSERDILSLMYGYGISLKALLLQLHEAGLVDDERVSALLREGPGRLSYLNGFRSEWTVAHRTSIGVRRPPSRLEARCVAAYRAGLIGIGPVADLLGRDDAETLREELAEEGIAQPEFTPDLDALGV